MFQLRWVWARLKGSHKRYIFALFSTALLAVLAQDPRPHYQEDPERVYGFGFAGMEVRFSVADGVLTVREILEDRR